MALEARIPLAPVANSTQGVGSLRSLGLAFASQTAELQALASLRLDGEHNLTKLFASQAQQYKTLANKQVSRCFILINLMKKNNMKFQNYGAA
eukprot:scaffold273789_cov39-Prasinocladus_malaysianus.AAC.1